VEQVSWTVSFLAAAGAVVVRKAVAVAVRQFFQ
jgi:hypothetical protein